MELLKPEIVARDFGIDEDLLYGAIGRGLVAHTKEGESYRIRLNKKSRLVLQTLADSAQNRQFRIKELKRRIKLQERIIKAKDETIAAKDNELNSIKEVYNNLLHLYQETKALAASKTPTLEKPAAIPEGYVLLHPGVFTTRMQELGFSLDAIKSHIVEGVVAGEMDFVADGLVVEEDFFVRVKGAGTKKAKG